MIQGVRTNPFAKRNQPVSHRALMILNKTMHPSAVAIAMTRGILRTRQATNDRLANVALAAVERWMERERNRAVAMKTPRRKRIERPSKPSRAIAKSHLGRTRSVDWSLRTWKTTRGEIIRMVVVEDVAVAPRTRLSRSLVIAAR